MVLKVSSRFKFLRTSVEAKPAPADSIPPEQGSTPINDGHKEYESFQAARRANGIARIMMGMHLVALQCSGSWRGKSSAASFRRFLIEEGLQPIAVQQYMSVAKAFVMEHCVDPRIIGGIPMRVLVEATKYLSFSEVDEQQVSNVDDVLAAISDVPAAEAICVLQESFEVVVASKKDAPKKHGSAHVSRILSSMDDLTFEDRTVLFTALRIRTDATGVSVH
jgi:hypothetical protein